MRKTLIHFMILLFVLMGAFGCIGLKEGTPTEKVVFTSQKTLETAKIFRETGLASAKIFWDQGLMKMETKDKIVEVANNLQAAINSAGKALKIFHDTNGAQGGTDLDAKIQMYQAIYGQFVDLVMPYVLKLE